MATAIHQSRAETDPSYNTNGMNRSVSEAQLTRVVKGLSGLVYEASPEKSLEPAVARVLELQGEMRQKSDSELRGYADHFRQKLEDGSTLDDILPQAYACAREVAKRQLGQEPNEQQVLTAVAIHKGSIAEMKTGEGKTLAATMPAYLNALKDEGVHIVTVNEALAVRDAGNMMSLYESLGLSVGVIYQDMPEEDKKFAYGCDITYGTHSEFGFDYLRDNMAKDPETVVQRGHSFAIVDEADSVFIDEARTPLVINNDAEKDTSLIEDSAEEEKKAFEASHKVAGALAKGRDYQVDEKERTVTLTERGNDKAENMLGIENLYDGKSNNLLACLSASLKAKELKVRNRDYIVEDGEVKIVDEQTGRIMEGRRWSDGVHQATEAKEGLEIQPETQTYATISLQNYFKLYGKLSGMSGTALTSAREFKDVYKLEVVPVPTHLEIKREDKPDLMYKTEEAKLNAVVADIVARHEHGQPVLIGTTSVKKSEELSARLAAAGIQHQVLNAKEHDKEMPIIAQAGVLGAVTIATNMAGRGVDIHLGGDPAVLARYQQNYLENIDPNTPEGQLRYQELLSEFEELCRREGEAVKQLGGLYVIGTERHEARRIDDQLIGRSGRRGDIGESRFYLSLEDELMRFYGEVNKFAKLALETLASDEAPFEGKAVDKAVRDAQRKIESKYASQRKNLLKFDEPRQKQRQAMYETRQKILETEELEPLAFDFMQEVAESLVDRYQSKTRTEREHGELVDYVILDTKTGLSRLAHNDPEQAKKALVQEMIDRYQGKRATMPDVMFQIIQRNAMLHVLDIHWQDHLVKLDNLQDGIYLRAMIQKKPEEEFAREAHKMYKEMTEAIKRDFVKIILNFEANVPSRV